MFKIIFLGNSPKYFPEIKEVVSSLGIQITFKKIPKSKLIPQIDNQAEFIIIDFSELNHEKPEQLKLLNNLHKNSKQFAIALLPKDKSNLIEKILKVGVKDFIFTPVDRLELKSRIFYWCEIFKLELQKRSHIGAQIYGNYFEFFNHFLSEIIEKIQNQDKKQLLEIVLSNIRKISRCPYVVYFDIKKDKEDFLILRYSIPANPVDYQISLPLKTLKLTEENFSKEVVQIYKLTKDNEFNTFLKSYFNIVIENIYLIPVKFIDKNIGICIFFSRRGEKLNQFQSNLIQLFIKILKISYIMSDFSVSKKKSNSSKYSFDFLTKLVNELNFGIIVINEQQNIEFINKSALELFQASISDTLGCSMVELIGEENVVKIMNHLEKTSNTFFLPEIELTNKEGEKILVGFSVSPLQVDSNDEQKYIISLFDITYAYEVQEELRRMDRLASLGVMASGIAHEIRNPLAGIKAIAQTFEEELSADDPKIEFVKRIIRQVNRLDEMLKILFSYAKPQKPNRKFHRVQGILQEVLSLLGQKLRERDIKLVQSYSPVIPDIYVDSGQIQQVLFNLILNSIEAIEKSGKIEIIIEPVSKRLKRFQRKPFFQKITQNPYLLIHITDNGCGISKEDMKQIFNPFFTTKPFGTGLGLSIVYQIVKENNGIIYFESEVNKGTDCYLFLPAYN